MANTAFRCRPPSRRKLAAFVQGPRHGRARHLQYLGVGQHLRWRSAEFADRLVRALA
jgi:hypothetical protein